MRANTRMVRGEGFRPGLGHVEPIDLSTTYRTPHLDEAGRSMERLAAGEASADNPIYARLLNPNVRAFEEQMAFVERGEDAVAFASGMAAISALLLAARRRGGHIVAVPPLYGGTHHLLTSGLLGTTVSWAEPEDVGATVGPDTALVLVESPANPTLAVVDIARLARVARPAALAVDSTFATPVLQQPILHGATLVIHSATKFLGGHGDAMGGVVVSSDRLWAKEMRGLQTLPLRVRAQQETARQLVRRLARHPEVMEVLYPGRGDADSRAIVARQMSGPGSLFGLRLTGGATRADAFIGVLRLATPAVSLGSVDTLVQRPAALTHRAMDGEARARARIPDELIRVSVGAEDVEDLWEDFERALALSKGAPDEPLTRPRPAGSALTPTRVVDRCPRFQPDPLARHTGPFGGLLEP